MGYPKKGRATVRWSKGEQDFVVSWGESVRKGPAGGFLCNLIDTTRFEGKDETERFIAAMKHSGFDHTTFKARIDVVRREGGR